MQHIEVPDPQIWEARKAWIEKFIYEYEEADSYHVGEQASALSFDVQSCFCAGAWVSVIIVAFSVIEAHLRETDRDSSSIKNSYELIKKKGWDEKLTGLRKLRNRYVHSEYDNPALTIDEQWDDRDKLEERAKDAVRLMFEVFYSKSRT